MIRQFCAFLIAASTLTAAHVPVPVWAQAADSAVTARPAAESPQSLARAIEQSKPEWSLTAGKAFWSLIILFIGYLAIKYATRFLEALSERWPNMRLGIKRAHPVLRISGWTAVIYVIIADVLAPPIASLVAITASTGIAVGLAAQDIVKNIFGGLLILFDRPFQVGDKIGVGQYYGEVTEIGLCAVRIVTPSDSVVSIPNSEIVNKSVSNANSGRNNCQVVAEFYLTPEVNITRAKEIALRAAAVSRYVYLEKPISVVLRNEVHEGRSLIRLSLKAYVLDIRFEFPFLSEMTELVIAALVEQGVADPARLAAMN